jgi:hypothetical protein
MSIVRTPTHDSAYIMNEPREGIWNHTGKQTSKTATLFVASPTELSKFRKDETDTEVRDAHRPDADTIIQVKLGFVVSFDTTMVIRRRKSRCLSSETGTEFRVQQTWPSESYSVRRWQIDAECGDAYIPKLDKQI